MLKKQTNKKLQKKKKNLQIQSQVIKNVLRSLHTGHGEGQCIVSVQIAWQ